YPPGSYDYSRGNTYLPRIRELGFRLAPHDIPAACALMLLFAMEPRADDHGQEGEGREIEEGDGEDEEGRRDKGE
ncbi:hypothetical protein FS749_003575, partial [Ceratobasidium sp. UAMH 11750]